MAAAAAADKPFTLALACILQLHSHLQKMSTVLEGCDILST